MTYMIQQGDNLWDIARRYGVSVEQLLALNPGINPQNLALGQVIYVPSPMGKGPRLMPYVIQQGDYPWKIANRFGITVEQILALNPGINPNDLRIGQVIYLPVTR